MVGELDACERVTGARPDACMWHSFHDPDVRAVLQAFDWFDKGQVREFWGHDPPWWMVEGVRHYHRALEAVRADMRAVRRAEQKATRARLPSGYQVEGEIRG